ncbi:MAG: hypothetical protein IJS41_03680, partial [Clostridia bacterium]|nr:hypothetical protein [Clostridia bacterium]
NHGVSFHLKIKNVPESEISDTFLCSLFKKGMPSERFCSSGIYLKTSRAKSQALNARFLMQYFSMRYV